MHSLWLLMPESSLWVIGHSSARFRNEMERDRHFQTWRRMWQRCGTHDEQPTWKWAPRISCNQCIGPRTIEKGKEVEIYPTFCARTMLLLLTRCFALLFLSLGSVCTGQSQICVKNSLLYWLTRRKLTQVWNNQSQCLNPLICWTFKDHSRQVSNHRATCCRITRTSEESFGWSAIDQILYRCRIHQNSRPGKYFMTKYAGEFSEFDGHVVCRECTLPRDDKSSTPKGWIRGNVENWSGTGSGDQLPSQKARRSDQNRGSEYRTDLTNSWEIWQRKHELLVTMNIIQQAQGNL